MKRIIVTGIGTGVGKTVTAAILTKAINAEYWKPIESGTEIDSDTETVRMWLPNSIIHPSSYSLKAPLSPHHAAKLENINIDRSNIVPPKTSKNLVIETVGGVMVPLNDVLLTIDLFSSWNCMWIIVANCYLGSINHTLITIDLLKKRGIKPLGIILNGNFTPESELAILHHSKISCLARINEEKNIDQKIIYQYAEQWKNHFLNLT